jgi:uncharacterized protein YjbJ (UPF0337 family)
LAVTEQFAATAQEETSDVITGRPAKDGGRLVVDQFAGQLDQASVLQKKRSFAMGLPNKAEIKGKINKAKGTVKENIGHAVGNRRVENDGAADRRKGSVQETVGKAKRKVGDAVKDLGNNMRK